MSWILQYKCAICTTNPVRKSIKICADCKQTHNLEGEGPHPEWVQELVRLSDEEFYRQRSNQPRERSLDYLEAKPIQWTREFPPVPEGR